MMENEYRADLCSELGLGDEVYEIPSITILRDLSKAIVDFEENYANTLIWTRLNPPKPLGSYDLVHIHNSIPLAAMVVVAMASRRADVPYCVTTHGISKIPDLPKQMDLGRIQRAVFRLAFLRPYRWVLQNSTHLFALSEGDKLKLEQFLSEPSVSVIPNGVDMSQSTPQRRRNGENLANLSSDESLLLFVGKIRRSKGVSDLLSAFERLEEDAKLVIVGQGQESELVKQIETLDTDSVLYLGYLDKRDLDTLYHRADLFVFPTRSDVFPLVTLEAMAAGTPVVSTTVGGIPEQVSEETGNLVPPKQPDELAGAIDELLDNDVKRAEMSEEAMNRVQREFSWDSVARRTVEDYQSIIKP